MFSKTINYQPSQFRQTDDTFWNICCDLFAICFCTLRPSHNGHHLVDYISTNQRIQRSLFLNVFSDSKVQGSKHGAHLGPIGPRWAPCWPHETCYLGYSLWACGTIYTPRNHATIGSVWLNQREYVNETSNSGIFFHMLWFDFTNMPYKLSSAKCQPSSFFNGLSVNGMDISARELSHTSRSIFHITMTS